MLYRYVWKGYPGLKAARSRFTGRICRLATKLRMNSCFVRFEDNGEEAIVSLNAIRKVKVF